MSKTFTARASVVVLSRWMRSWAIAGHELAQEHRVLGVFADEVAQHHGGPADGLAELAEELVKWSVGRGRGAEEVRHRRRT
jgi:hypothetical protein